MKISIIWGGGGLGLGGIMNGSGTAVEFFFPPVKQNVKERSFIFRRGRGLLIF